MKSADELNARERERAAVRCRHFNGIGLDRAKCCEAGVNYRSHVGGPDFGWGIRIPCIGNTGAAIVPCAKFEKRTPEEIAQSEREMQESIDRMMQSMALVSRIKKDNKGKSASGEDPCPVKGCAGRVLWGIASFNGHVRMRCNQPDCIAFME